MSKAGDGVPIPGLPAELRYFEAPCGKCPSCGAAFEGVLATVAEGSPFAHGFESQCQRCYRWARVEPDGFVPIEE